MLAGGQVYLSFFCFLGAWNSPDLLGLHLCKLRWFFRRDARLWRLYGRGCLLFQHDFSHSGFFVAFDLQQIDSTWQVGEVDFLLLGLE